MTPCNLIAINTLASYARTIFVSGLGLFTTRWVLEALGKTDYGLYLAVGGLVSFLSFVNISLSVSASRHFAFAMGSRGADEVNKWFNASFVIHVFFAVFFLCAAIPFGVWAFHGLISIPMERLTACRWVYVCSVLTVMLNVLAVPFNAMFLAKQRIFELTIIQALNTVLVFVFALLLFELKGDKLIVYAVGLVLITLIIFILQVGRCLLGYPECQIHSYKFDRSRTGAILSFCSWSLVSTFAFIFRGQGLVVLLNNLVTPGSSAALGIANQVSGYAGTFSNSLMGAISPEMTTREGAGNEQGMTSLAIKSCKYTTYLVLFLALPLLTDAGPVLHLWLREVPPDTETFLRIVIWVFILCQAVSGAFVGIRAYGKIKWPECVSAIILMMAIPLAWMCLKQGLSPFWAVLSLVLSTIGTSIVNLYYAHQYFSFSLRQWWHDAIVSCLILMFVSLGVARLIHLLLGEGLVRFFIVTLVDWTLLAGSGWFIIFNTVEREMFRIKIKTSIAHIMKGGR